MLNAHPSLSPSVLWGTHITLSILFLAGCNEPRGMYEYDCFASDNGCPTGFECRLGGEDRGICFEIPTEPTEPPYPESPPQSPLETSDATPTTDVDVSDSADTRVESPDDVGPQCEVERVECEIVTTCDGEIVDVTELSRCYCDDCGVCDTDRRNDNTTCQRECDGVIDCAGECNGNARRDPCGQCDANPNNDCVREERVWGHWYQQGVNASWVPRQASNVELGSARMGLRSWTYHDPQSCTETCANRGLRCDEAEATAEYHRIFREDGSVRSIAGRSHPENGIDTESYTCIDDFEVDWAVNPSVVIFSWHDGTPNSPQCTRTRAPDQDGSIFDCDAVFDDHRYYAHRLCYCVR